jgi:YegS/Rv2252/BmrU family lipid kinase
MPGTYVIVNPWAARGRTGNRWPELRDRLSRHAVLAETNGPGHGEELALEAARSGYGTVVAAGGDGTVHEVANGVLRAGRPEVRFGVLPLGSGNDYAAALGLSNDWQAACDGVLSDRVRRVDVGEVRDERGRSRFFVNTLGLGLSGAVALESRSIKRLRGLAMYGLATLKALAKHFRQMHTTLTIDGQSRETRTVMLTVALGFREGGGFIVAPDAKLDDGLFDILHAGNLSLFRTLCYAPRLTRGDIPRHPEILSCRCQTISLAADQPLIVHIDGEFFARPEDQVRRVEIRLLPGALAVVGNDEFQNPNDE